MALFSITLTGCMRALQACATVRRTPASARRLSLFAAALVLLSSSAALFAADEPAAPVSPLVLNATLDKPIYRPGEAAVLNVSVRNTGKKAMQVRRLDATSIQLAYNKLAETETPVYRDPVFSPNQNLGGFVSLAPGKEMKQAFTYTRLTYYQGEMKAQVQYDPNTPGAFENGPKVFGNVLHFEVGGQPLFDRDPTGVGLIKEEEAVKLAKAQTTGNVTDAKTLVVQDKNTGLYATWVNLTVSPPAGQTGETSLLSFLIDPYKGRVMGPSKPFNPAAAEDPRFIRPANLPPKQGLTGGKLTPANGVPAPAPPTNAATAPASMAPAAPEPAAAPPVSAPQAAPRQAPPAVALPPR